MYGSEPDNNPRIACASVLLRIEPLSEGKEFEHVPAPDYLDGNYCTGYYDIVKEEPLLFEKRMKRVAVSVEDSMNALPEILEEFQEVFDSGISSIAICLLHSYIYPKHEEIIETIAEDIGYKHCSLSSRLTPMIRVVPRGHTSCVDAYLTPLIMKYIENFKKKFDEGINNVSVLFMKSDGGLCSVSDFTGFRSILSGPAGGVVAAAVTAYDTQSNTTHTPRATPVIGFDMGGTSTDVSRYDGHLEHVMETETAGISIQAPQLDITTVAAGGGSRLSYRSGMFSVGPESAGAHPGPICYRKDGYLAVTDANLYLGRISPDFFPHIFGSKENLPLDYDGAALAFKQMAKRINQNMEEQNQKSDRPKPILKPEEVAAGFLAVANETMARPIRSITEARGYNTNDHILTVFGGAGPQHCCAVGCLLGIKHVLIPKYASVLSAYGMSCADVVAERQEPCSDIYSDEKMCTLQQRLNTIDDSVRASLFEQGFSKDTISTEHYLNLRYDGTDTCVMTSKPVNGDYVSSFIQRYEREFGFTLPDRCYFSDVGWITAPVFNMVDLGVFGRGITLKGPCFITSETTTISVDPHCTAEVTKEGDVFITIGNVGGRAISTEYDPIHLSVFAHRFMSVAEQMGRTLQRTAVSTNIKERLDFSCAIFGPDGGLVANAPHLPVHLGSMSEAVKYQIGRRGETLKQGHVILSNHPIAGGSHLPDITVITPVFSGDRVMFYVASRGHHADIGGMTPGSMPPFSRSLDEEGLAVRSLLLVKDGIFQEKDITALLKGKAIEDSHAGEVIHYDHPVRSPSRNLKDNISDLKAQVAANHKGTILLNNLIDLYSVDIVQAYMHHVQNQAEAAVRDTLKHICKVHGMKSKKESRQAIDYLDDGTPIRLKLSIDPFEGSAVFDFSGTGYELFGNLNAPTAVTKSAILYCLRALVKEDIPLNAGCLRPITILIPRGTVLSPSDTAAVVGGNVLTSQRVTDIVLTAFSACANSQGCMNNFTFGDDNIGYYETIAGGAGAGPNWVGRSGVQTHMTNTRITDAEVLERRYPIILRQFSIRKESGGEGKNKGGDGLVREFQFLRPLTVAILSERRSHCPNGLNGGGDGARGLNLLKRNGNDKWINIGGKAQISVDVGDVVCICTPGGGGYGAA